MEKIAAWVGIGALAVLCSACVTRSICADGQCDSFRTLPMHGKFNGELKTLWDHDHRRMIVLEDFSFTDQHGNVFTAKKDTLINGASIPRIFWSFVGSPYTGCYRRASVIHDAEYAKIGTCYLEKGKGNPECDRKRQEADDMLYNASLADGCVEMTGMLFYSAVSLFGKDYLLADKKINCDQQDCNKVVADLDDKTRNLIDNIRSNPETLNIVEKLKKDDGFVLDAVVGGPAVKVMMAPSSRGDVRTRRPTRIIDEYLKTLK
ncbi:MAG: DUF1353 domain-containing protein [Magnetococcales bacterium]|nr:DUF1353 domain-containing protein [Magnetococcales bacterium]